MLYRFMPSFLLVVLLFLVTGNTSKGQNNAAQVQELKEQLDRQNTEIQNLRNKLNTETTGLKADAASYTPIAMVLFLFGGFCAVWAQNTGRNTWFWFFSGIVFSVLAVMSIIFINSNNR